MTWVVRIVKKLSFLLLLSLFASNIYADVDIGAIDPAEEIGWASSTQLLPNSDGGLLVRTNAGSNRLTLDSSGNCTLAASVTATSNVTLGASGVFSFNGSTETVANGNGGFIVRTSADAARLTLTSAGNLTAAGSVTATTNATLGASSVLSFSGSTEFVANGDGGFISRTAADSPTLTLSSSGNLSAVGSVTAGTFLSAPEQASDPSAPSGAFKVWQSNGTGTGDDGDIYVSINDGSTTNTALLYDFSANAFQGSGGGGGLAEEDLDDVTSGQEIGWDAGTDLVDNGDGGLIVRNAADTATATLDATGTFTVSGDVIFGATGNYKLRETSSRFELHRGAAGRWMAFDGSKVIIYGGNDLAWDGLNAADITCGREIRLDHGTGYPVKIHDGSSPAELNICGIGSGTTDYENLVVKAQSGANFLIETTAGGTGTDRGLTIDAANLNFSNLPTSDPSVAGQLWNDAGTLKVSAGP